MKQSGFSVLKINKWIIKLGYTLENGIYRKLRPIWVKIDLRNFEKTHQHEPTDDHLEQDTNQENDYGYHYGFCTSSGSNSSITATQTNIPKNLQKQ